MRFRHLLVNFDHFNPKPIFTVNATEVKFLSDYLRYTIFKAYI